MSVSDRMRSRAGFGWTADFGSIEHVGCGFQASGFMRNPDEEFRVRERRFAET